VKTIALTWHPDESPDRAAMTAAADNFLAAMGWQEHQAILVRHTDTKHPHVHIILSRVHPESGLTLDDGNERRRAQKWAHGYEQEHGRIWCEERARKYGPAGDRTRNPTDTRHDYHQGARDAQARFTAAEATLESHDRRHERAQLSHRHKAERDEFFEERRAYVKAIRTAVYEQVRDDWRETWRDHYRYATTVRAEARGFAAHEQLVARTAIRAGNFDLARASLEARDSYLKLAEDTIRAERTSWQTDQRADTKDRQNEAAAAFINERYADYDAMKDCQQTERREVKTLQDAREKGRSYADPARLRHDADRLAQLLAPHQPRGEPDPQKAERIGELLDKMRERHGRQSKGRDPMSRYQDLDDSAAHAQRDEDMRRANIEIMQRRKIETQTRDQHHRHVDQLNEVAAAATAQQTQEAKDRLAAHAAEQEAEAKRAPEIAAIQAQQQSDDREVRARADASYYRSAADRSAQALGRYYDVTQPHRSLAAAAMHEHELFQKERDELRQQIGQENDPAKRHLLELRDMAERLDYAATLFHRNGRLSEINTGRRAEPDPTRQRPDERLHEAMREVITGQRGNEDARRDFEQRDQCRARAAEVRQQAHLERQAIERREMDAARAPRDVAETQRAHTQRTEADRTQQGPRTAEGWVAETARRQEAANFRSASRGPTTTRGGEGQGKEAREDDASRDRGHDRGPGRGRGR